MSAPADIDIATSRNDLTWTVRLVSGLAILALGVVGFMMMAAAADVTPPEPPKALPPAVEVEPLKVQDLQFRVKLSGMVQPLKESMIVAQVGGKIESVEPVFLAGGVVKKDQTLLTLESADYDNAVAQAEAAVANAEAMVAQREAMIAQARAQVKSADAALAQAEAALTVDDTNIAKAREGVVQAKAMHEQALAAAELERTMRERSIAEWEEYAEKTGKDKSKIPANIAREQQRKDVEARVKSAKAGIAVAEENRLAAVAAKVLSQKAVEAAKAARASAAEGVKVAQENKNAAAKQVESSKAALARAKLDQARCVIKAPFAGNIQSINVNQGQMAMPGTVLCHLVSLDKVQIEIPVPESQIGYIGVTPNNDGTITARDVLFTTKLGAKRVQIEAKITRYNPILDAATRSYTIYAEVDNTKAMKETPAAGGQERDFRLLPGNYVELEVLGRKVEKVYEVDRAAMRNSAPDDVEAKFSDAKWFIVVFQRDADGATVKDSHDAEFALGEAHFIPVELVRNEGARVIVKEVPAGDSERDTTLNGKQVVTTHLEIISESMRLRLAEKINSDAAKTEK